MVIELTKKELEPFRQLQKVPFEIGGILDVNEGGFERAGFVSGEKLSISSKQLPRYTIQYHTHPSYPGVPSDRGIFEYFIEQLDEKDISKLIDIVVQSVSEKDILAFIGSIVNGRLEAMMIFSPEGIYILKGNREQLRILTQNVNAIELLKIKGNEFTDRRNRIILEKANKLEEKIKRVSEKEKVVEIEIVQVEVGMEVCKLIKEMFRMVDCKYFPWQLEYINFKIDCCSLNSKQGFSELISQI